MGWSGPRPLPYAAIRYLAIITSFKFFALPVERIAKFVAEFRNKNLKISRRGRRSEVADVPDSDASVKCA